MRMIAVQRFERRRGSVVVLVVAVLALLVVIGTVYIVSARSERTAAGNSASAYNLDLAQQAVQNNVLNVILKGLFDANGQLGGLSKGTTGMPSRFFDCPPEVFANSKNPFNPTLNPDSDLNDLVNANLFANTTAYNGKIPNEAWLAEGLYRASGDGKATPLDVDFSMLTPTFFDPATGQYDITLFQGVNPAIPSLQQGQAQWPPVSGLATPYYLCNVVANPMPGQLGGPNVNPDPTVANPPGIVADPTVIAAGAAGQDAIFNLLPFSDASGVRYRYGVRIVDTSRMANLNVGSPGSVAQFGSYSPPADFWNTPQGIDMNTGTYITSYDLATDSLGVTPWGTSHMLFYQTVDTSRNAGVADIIGNLHSSIGRKGTSLLPLASGNAGFQYDIWQRELLMQEYGPTNLGYSNSLNAGTTSLFDLSDELALRANGNLGLPGTSRPSNALIWFNTLSNMVGNNSTSTVSTKNIGNVRRGNYTTISYSREPRPYADTLGLADPLISPTPLAPIYQLKQSILSRPNFPLPPLVPVGTVQVWPPRPARISANPWLNYPGNASVTADSDGAYYLAMAATNIATAMEACGYTTDESRSFAANYMTYRWNSGHYVLGKTWSSSNGGGYTGGAIDLYELPVWTWRGINVGGPSFIDDAGICVRAVSPTSTNPVRVNFGDPGNTTNLNAGVAKRVYMGYAAQPFINEVAVNQDEDYEPQANPPIDKIDINDTAIELYNPYDVPLSLTGFKLRTGSGTDVDLSKSPSGDTNYVPAGGYFVVVCFGGGANSFVGDKKIGPAAPAPSSQAPYESEANVALQTSGTQQVKLLREYVDRGGNVALALVDEYGYANLILKPSKTQINATYYTEYRSNSPSDPWRATVHYLPQSEPPAPPTPATQMTIGGPNPADSSISVMSLPLWDRYAEKLVEPPGTPPASGTMPFALPLGQGGPLANIRDFNRIMRITNVFDTSTPEPVPTGPGLISQQLATIYTATNVPPPPWKGNPLLGNPRFPYDAQLHFDFQALPQLYNSPNVPMDYGASPPPGNSTFGDVRAVRLLDQLAMIDRVSDYSINIGDGINGLSKLRIPGQININTASADVLMGIPAIANAVNAGGVPIAREVVGDILAYRWRTAGETVGQSRGDPRIPALIRKDTNFATNTPAFNNPLMFPGYGFRSMAELNFLLSYVNASPGATIDQRDALWADMYNLCTVRSDTFVLYGYIEAVRANPNYIVGGGHNNGTDWYGPAVNDARDAGTNIPNIRVARRRWVSIIDRSWSNDTNTPARVVASRDLPQ